MYFKKLISLVLATLTTCSPAFATQSISPRYDIVTGQNTAKNFLIGDSSHFEKNVGGWVAFADAAASSPVDLTGGSPSATCTRTASSPLAGDGSFLITKGASNLQGNGCSINFSIDVKDKGKMIRGSINYAIASGTFADNDIDVWIYDVTNSKLIQPAPYHLQNHSLASEHLGFEFQSASNSVSYRVGLYIASTSATAYTVKLDDLKISSSVDVAKTYGSPVTDWVSYTPIFTGFGSPTNVSFSYRRVGDSVEISGRLDPGSSNATEARISLPAGLTVDGAKLTTTRAVGQWLRALADASSVSYYVLAQPNVGYLNAGIQTAIADPLTLANEDAVSGTQTTTITALVPITGWGSSVVMSSDADTRVIASKAYLSSATVSVANGAVIPFDTIDFDKTGSWDTGTYGYLVKTPGLYDVEVVAGINSSASLIYAVNSRFPSVNNYMNAVAANTTTGKITLEAIAGDVISIYSASSGSVSYNGSSPGQTSVCIKKVSGPAQIAASESVNATYNKTAFQLLSSATMTTVVFDTKVKDTHGSYNNSTGVFTVQSAGDYEVNAAIPWQGDTTGGRFLTVYKNGTLWAWLSIINPAFSGSAFTQSGMATVTDCKAGDTIEIRAQQNNGGTLNIAAGGIGSNDSFMTIKKVGN